MQLHSPTVIPNNWLIAAFSGRASVVRTLLYGSTLLLLLILAPALRSQVVTGEGARYPGTTGEASPIDSTGLQEGRSRTEVAAGLLERPIDPALYPVGPNDALTLTIWTGTSLQYDLMVTPDAKLVIPRVGEVDVRGKSLAEAKQIVRDAVGRVYRAGDVALTLRKMREFKVHLIGAVRRPGTVAATPTTRVSEVIDLVGGVLSTAEKRYIEIIRDGKKISVDLLPFYTVGNVESNPTVEAGDVIRVGVQDPKNVIAIFGAVNRPGEFGFRTGDSISSLINYAQGFSSDAMLDSVEVVSVDSEGHELKRVFYSATFDGSVAGDRPLQPGDRVFVRSRPGYLSFNRVIVSGEVRYPGSFAIEPGVTRLREVLIRSGGFTSDASVNDATLIRQSQASERDPRWERILQIDPKDRTPDEVDYYRVKTQERPGVMAVNFNRLLAGDESENIILLGNDSLYVPSTKGFIKVTGRVKNPGNITYRTGRTYREYVLAAGGFGWKADEGETRIIKGKNGDTFLASSEDNYELEPGDAVFVPEAPDGDFWKGFTSALTVFAQVATVVAVVVSILR